ncbi:DUF4240 domain-containing protein [Catellatospora citrea]|nr:DUF4240 domain-containing protein [Catellatospora citrea]RKE07812.1 uncharacterized protein DUF4240 [Catellatospora citrea]
MLGFTRRTMSEQDFWALVDVMGGRTDHEAVARLRDALSALRSKDVVAFHRRFVERLHELDREVLAEQPVRWVDDPSDSLPLSDDSFLYLRAGIVAMGRATYESVLTDPTVLARGRWDECEELLYLADEVTGTDIETALSFETGSNTRHWSVHTEPEREPWDQGLRPVAVGFRDMSAPIHCYRLDAEGHESPMTVFPPPRWLDAELDHRLTLSLARSVALQGGLPPDLGCEHVRVHVDIGESWRLHPEVSAPRRDEDDIVDGPIVEAWVGAPAGVVRSWSSAEREEALGALAALALLAVLPADHAARAELQALYELGGHRLPANEQG